MLHRINELTKYSVEATDGNVGHIDDVIFDETDGKIRYVVVDTNDWLPGGKVLVPPMQMQDADTDNRAFRTELTREQVKEQPPISFDKPVSRQMEAELHRHYGWHPYWVRGPLEGPVPGQFTTQKSDANADSSSRSRTESNTAVAEEESPDSHLRSCSELIGYSVDAADDSAGKLSDIVIDDHAWNLRYLVVDTGSWLSTRNVLLSFNWIEGISWERSGIAVGIDRETIKDSPPFDSDRPIERQYEEMLFNYYGRKKYWIDNR